jgi:membrane-associated PAP2 superfamily phosphatase
LPASKSAHKTLLWWWMSLTFALLMWDASGLDLIVSAWFGDAHGFALREHPVWGRGMYQLQRVLGWSAFACLLWLTVRPRGVWLLLAQRDRWIMLITVLAVASLIPVLKKFSATSCPWDLAQFGGAAKAQWISHWRWGVPDGGSQHCFPAGHSSTAFSFLAAPVFLLAVCRPWALRLMLLIAVAGVWMGFTQVYRGAHYVSHSLWTAWISLSAGTVLALLFSQQRETVAD